MIMSEKIYDWLPLGIIILLLVIFVYVDLLYLEKYRTKKATSGTIRRIGKSFTKIINLFLVFG
jgi:hypothetical protein